MVWKLKLPDTPRSRYSARELAGSWGVPVSEVMDALRAIGEYVPSPDKKTVEEPVRRRLSQQLGIAYLPPTPGSISPWRRIDTTDNRPDKLRRKRRSEPQPIRSGSFGPKRNPFHLGRLEDDASATMEDVAWKLYDFTDAERDAWRSFLGRGQAKYARELRDAGLQPDDLGVVVFGWTVRQRLSAGETAVEVLRLLDRQRSAG